MTQGKNNYLLFLFITPLFLLTTAITTNTVDHYLHFIGFIPFRQVDAGRNHIIKADGPLTVGTYKMHMVIMVMAFLAILAERIADGIIGGRYGVDDALFHKGLKRTVDSYTVELFPGLIFNISMGQCVLIFKEKGQDFFPALGNAEVFET